MRDNTQSEIATSTSIKQAEACSIPPRQSRVLRALIEAPDWIDRKQVDRIAGTANCPQLIKEIRLKVTGQDGIYMERVEKIDRDGKLSKPGRYRLNEIGRSRAIGHFASTALQEMSAPFAKGYTRG